MKAFAPLSEQLLYFQDDQLSTSSSNQDSGRSRNGKFQFPTTDHKVKTELCKYWLQQVTCPF